MDHPTFPVNQRYFHLIVIQADYDRRFIQKLNETIEPQKEEICRAHQEDERRRRDQQLLHAQLLQQNWELREAHKSLKEMEELKKFQSSTFDYCKTKISRGSGYYYGTHSEDSGTTE